MKGCEKKRNGHTVYEINRRRNLSVTSLCFFAISFFGWVYETGMCYVAYGRYCDRGFLGLPLCPIYGASVCLFILFFGTPKEGTLARLVHKLPLKGEFSSGWKRAIAYVCYFFTSAVLVTAMEYAVGAYFRSRGVKLWGYASYPANYQGLICLPVSLLWGALFTLFSTFLWKPLYKTLSKIPKSFALSANVALWTALSVDFCLRFFAL